MTTDAILLFLEEYVGESLRANFQELADFFARVYSVLQDLFEGLDLGNLL